MRYVTFDITPNEPGELNPAREVVLGDEDLTFEAVHYVTLLGDGTSAQLWELTADDEVVERVLERAENHPDILNYTVSGTERRLAYIHTRITAPEAGLFGLMRDVAVAVAWPVTVVGHRTYRITAVGEGDAIAGLLDGIPEEYDVTLRETGSYRTPSDSSDAGLTRRQREIARLAAERGYYAIPRETTQRELASELGLATGTVAEHLRRIESKLVLAEVSP